MRGNLRDDTSERSDAEGGMVGNRHMVLAALLRRQSQ
jgi:hypothetical protein